jgi:predicted nucleic acid-binding protein
MKSQLLVDSDILVDFLRGRPEARAFIEAEFDRILLSAIVVAELYAGAKDDDELRELDELVSVFRVIPVTTDLARAAGLHKRDYHKSHGVGLADAIVAATAESLPAELKTLNVKHYPMFKGLKPPYVKRGPGA